MARIYIAGSYDRREELQQRAHDLAAAGHSVTSRWLKGNNELPKADQIDMDLVDLLASDTVVSFTGGGVTGGRHFELGYAAAMNDVGDKRMLVLVGHTENLFHHRDDLEQVTFDELLTLLPTVTGAQVMAQARSLTAQL